VRIISTIHDAIIVDTGTKDSKTNLEIKKPSTVVQYNKKFMKGIDRADQYLTYYCSEENHQMVEKGGIVSAKRYQHIFLCTVH
jgi:hypothetical protein